MLWISFCSSRNGRNFSYRHANRNSNTLYSTSNSILPHSDSFRPFQSVLANFGQNSLFAQNEIWPSRMSPTLACPFLFVSALLIIWSLSHFGTMNMKKKKQKKMVRKRRKESSCKWDMGSTHVGPTCKWDMGLMSLSHTRFFHSGEGKETSFLKNNPIFFFI